MVIACYIIVGITVFACIEATCIEKCIQNSLLVKNVEVNTLSSSSLQSFIQHSFEPHANILVTNTHYQ